MSVVALTIVVPAFNEQRRLPVSLPALAESVLAAQRHLGLIEVIVVDDGSSDGTASVAQSYFDLFSDARLIRLPYNCGKGTAVRAGVMAANGGAIVFMDADLSADLSLLPVMVGLLDGADVVLGSRRAQGANVHGRTRYRNVGGIVYNELARRMTGLTFRDTQCGFKAFRADAGKLIFSLCRSSGFGFDVEICTAAVAMGLRIVEFPIEWEAADGGTVRLRAHAAGMLVDLLRARQHILRSVSTPLSVGQMAPLVDSPGHAHQTLSITDKGRRRRKALKSKA